MKAITRFKSLLNPKAGTSSQPQVLSPGAEPADPTPYASPFEEQGNKLVAGTDADNEEVANRIIRERHEMLQRKTALLGAGPDENTRHPQALSPEAGAGAGEDASTTAATLPEAEQKTPVLHLGIGTGGIDDFSAMDSDQPTVDFVSDSPTTVDFSVYDRAFDAELERIRRTAEMAASPSSSSSFLGNNRRGSRQAGTSAGGAGATVVYSTRLKQIVDGNGDNYRTTTGAGQGGEDAEGKEGAKFVVAGGGNEDGDGNGTGSEAATPRSVPGDDSSHGQKLLHQRVGGATLPRFADMVTRAMRDAKGSG